MLVTKLQIDGQVFFLSDETDIEGLKTRLLAAAREGAGFVDFDARGHGRVSVLMTARVPVRFEISDRSDEDIEGWVDVPGSFELDPTTFIS